MARSKSSIKKKYPKKQRSRKSPSKSRKSPSKKSRKTSSKKSRKSPSKKSRKTVSILPEASLTPVNNYIKKLTKDYYTVYQVGNETYFNLNEGYGKHGVEGTIKKNYRDVQFNVDQLPGYFLKDFLRDVFGIKTSNLKVKELRQIFLERVEGSYSSK